jgi:hypothetical protein
MTWEDPPGTSTQRPFDFVTPGAASTGPEPGGASGGVVAEGDSATKQALPT